MGASRDTPSRRTRWREGSLVDGVYEVRERRGSGGMGVVDRVHHRDWGQDLAVKSPHAELWSGAGGLTAFVDEARVWVDLPHHENLCTCYFVRILDGAPRMFAEYVPAGSVSDALRAGRLPDVGIVLDVAIQTARGLAVAHGAGVVHQDVKPANILLSDDGTAKITDFGLARAQAGRIPSTVKVEDDGGSVLVTRGGLTWAYASPEQVGGERIGRRSDVWSWAVSVLELFVGSVTWRSGLEAPGVLARCRRPGAGASSGSTPTGRPDMPGPVAAVLDECLRVDPAERSADLDAVAARLADLFPQVVGRAYFRAVSPPSERRADAQNNVALSLLDLGEDERAAAAWEEALRLDGRHVDATTNRGLWRWRTGRGTADQLVRDLEALREAHRQDPRTLADVDDVLAAVVRERGAPSGTGGTPVAWRHSRPRPAAESGRHAAAFRELLGRAEELADDRDFAGAADLVRRARAVPGFERDHDAMLLWTRVSSTAPRLELVDARSHTFGWRDLGAVLDVTTTPTGSHDLCVGSAGVLHWFDLDAQHHQTLGLRNNAPRVVAMSDDGCIIAVGCATGETAVAYLHEPREPVYLGRPGHEGGVTAVAMTPEGRLLVTGGSDGLVRVGCGRDPLRGERVPLPPPDDRWTRLRWGRRANSRVLSGHAAAITAVGITRDGGTVVSGDRHGQVRCWDISDGRLLAVLDGDGSAVEDLTLMRGGQRLVIADAGGTVRWWHVPDERCRGTLRGHEGAVHSVALTGDGRHALSGGADHTVRLWELESGRCLRTFTEHTAAITSVAITEDALRGISGAQDGTIRGWRFDWNIGSPSIGP